MLEKLSPVLEQRLEAKGYKALNWAYVGWIHIFSKTPVTRSTISSGSSCTSTGDDRLARWYKKNGFTAVQIDSTAIITSLKTSMIEAVPSPPLFAQLLTWYQSAPYMMDLGFALLGATVMSTERWNALSAEDQAIVVDEARKAGARLRTDVPRLDREAIEAMRGRGLTVTKGDVAEWRRLAEQLGDAMRRDGVVPKASMTSPNASATLFVPASSGSNGSSTRSRARLAQGKSSWLQRRSRRWCCC